METVNFAFFEGPAGTGKTTALIDELSSLLKHKQLQLKEGQRILGLTYMHGARRRLDERLQKAGGLAGRFICSTFDSFAWHLLHRRRTLARELNGDIDKLVVTDFDAVCKNAGALLSIESVRQWLVRSYPIVIVDELQDIKQGRLDILKELAKTIPLIGAADEFQDLFDTGPNAAVAWAKTLCKPIPLARCRRTQQSGLLEAARLLRSGESLPRKIDSRCLILTPLNTRNAASCIATTLCWYPSPDSAILTPTGPESSSFVRDVIDLLTKGPLYVGKLDVKKSGKKVGPFPIRWEADQQREIAVLLNSLGLVGDDSASMNLSELKLTAKVRGVSALKESLYRRLNLTGESTIKVAEVKADAARMLQRIRSQSTNSLRGIKAMTIYQAKNREFENVIILWPHEVGGTPESWRRLLYNGVTRAKSRVLIIVHSPPDKKGQVKDRLAFPPFSP